MEEIGNMVDTAESSEEEFFEEFLLPIIGAGALESSIVGDNDGMYIAMHARRRRTRPSGAGTNRDNRSLPRAFFP